MMRNLKLSASVFPGIVFFSCLLLYLYSTLLPFYTHSPTESHNSLTPSMPAFSPSPPQCNLFHGNWVEDPSHEPIYDETCPFHRNAWNCLKNKRDNMGRINSWRWVPSGCDFPRIDPVGFLGLMRNRRIGFVGDSLNENFLASFLCILRVADAGAKRWKRKGAWRGAYFPKFNVTVAYHRAVLLAKYE